VEKPVGNSATQPDRFSGNFRGNMNMNMNLFNHNNNSADDYVQLNSRGC